MISAQRRTGDVTNGLAFLAQLDNLAHDLTRGFRVKRGGRLVYQQNRRILDKGAADADPLALTARQFVGAFVGHFDQADAIQQPECFIYV